MVTASAAGRRRWPGLLCIAGIVAILCVLAAQFLPFARAVENRVADLRTALRAPVATPHPDIVILEITEETLADLPYRSPIDRGFLAGLLDKLSAAGARAVGLDILFDRPTEPAKDRRLTAAIAAFPAPLVIAFADGRQGLTPDQARYASDYVAPALRGFATLLADPEDSTVRAIFPGYESDGRWVPGLAAALAAHVGAPAPRRSIPLAWRNPTDGAAPRFPAFPAHAAALLPDAWFAGQVVLIGANLPEGDRHRTPLAAIYDDARGHMAGVHIHAHALAQLLDGEEPAAASVVQNYLIAIAMAAIGVVLAAIDLALIAKVTAGVTAVLAFVVVGFAAHGWGVPPIQIVAPCVALGTAFGVASAYLGRRYRQQQRFIRQAFAHYVPPSVVESLRTDPSRLRLGGERRMIAMLFTDLTDFTTMSETLDPATLMALVNDYLDGMCRVVLDHGGTIDKFVGDAVAAFFGAPEEQADYAARAVACAIELDRFATAFAARQRSQGIAWGRTRIGIHAGPAVVGNVGGANRFDYTAVGDTANTASRMESANKAFGTRICVSAAAAAQCPNLAFRPIGEITLKGKQTEIEALQPYTDADDGCAAPDAYRAAYLLLRAAAPEAETAFANLAADWPDDPLVAFHLARLRDGETGARLELDQK